MTQIKLRRDVSTAWTSSNPILGSGEPGFETDTGKFKIGDGSTNWNNLAYSNTLPDLSNLSDAGKIVGSSLGIPSNTYDELTLGASNDNYTAPSNGWFCLQRRIDNDTISIADTTSGFANAAETSGSGRLLRIIYPAFKGCNVAVYYANSSSDTSKNYFRFYYAIGSESEAS